MSLLSLLSLLFCFQTNPPTKVSDTNPPTLTSPSLNPSLVPNSDQLPTIDSDSFPTKVGDQLRDLAFLLCPLQVSIAGLPATSHHLRCAKPHAAHKVILLLFCPSLRPHYRISLSPTVMSTKCLSPFIVPSTVSLWSTLTDLNLFRTLPRSGDQRTLLNLMRTMVFCNKAMYADAQPTHRFVSPSALF